MPARPSNARDFFDRITTVADPAVAIRQLADPAGRMSEEEWLECKADPLSDTRMGKAPAKDRESKLRSIWCQALSGFGNSVDGVLVWGLDARRGGDGTDCIRDLIPVDNPLALRSRLMEQQHGATDTPLSGVEVRAFEDPPGSGKGYVVCFIPEGAFKPYRAEIKDAKQYFIRVGDHFAVASSSLLRTLFYPKAQVHLKVRTYIWWEMAINPPLDAVFGCDFTVRNIGAVSARSLEIAVASVRPLNNWSRETGDQTWTHERTDSRSWLFIFPRILHPGAVAKWFRLTWTTPTTTAFSDHRVIPQSPDIEFRLSAFAEHQQPQYARILFGIEELSLPTCGRREATKIVVAEETEPW
jgi:hypothetical protein